MAALRRRAVRKRCGATAAGCSSAGTSRRNRAGSAVTLTSLDTGRALLTHSRWVGRLSWRIHVVPLSVCRFPIMRRWWCRDLNYLVLIFRQSSDSLTSSQCKLPQCLGTGNRNTAINQRSSTRNESRVIRGKIQHGPRQLFRLRYPLQRMQPGNESLLFSRIIHAVIHVGLHRAGQNGVNANSLRPEFSSQCLRQTNQPRLARRIGGSTGKSKLYPTKVEVKITDPAPCFAISAIWCLAPRKDPVRLIASASFQPASETPVLGPPSPSVPALLNAISSRPETLHRQSHECLGIILGAHITGQKFSLTTGRLNFGNQRGQLSLTPGAQHQFRAFLGKKQRRGPANAGLRP